MSGPKSFSLPAPAKINLGLRIVGRRADGYHLLQTAIQLLSYGDDMRFSLAEELDIQTHFHAATGLAAESLDQPHFAVEDNLVYRAAEALKAHTGFSGGAKIILDKYLPMGAGLGGGSSDAATALVGLNYLWQLGLDTETLMKIALPLGADVPVFVMGKSAWAEGIGERLTPIELPRRYYLIVKPECSIETVEIFSHQRLTRDSSTITIARLLGQGGIDKNDCEVIACQLYPEVKEVLSWFDKRLPNRLAKEGVAKMTGTGSCVFCAFDSQQEAKAVCQDVPTRWSAFVAEGLNDSPLASALAALD